MKDEMKQIASEIIARRLCLYQSKVYKWIEKYDIKFREVVNAPLDDVIESYMDDKPLKKEA